MHDDWNEDTGDGWDEEPDLDTDDDTETVVCANCRAEIYEDAVRCPECGHYVTAARGALAGRPPWWLVLGLLALVAFVLSVLGLG